MRSILLLIVVSLFSFLWTPINAVERPNVIIFLTDDQGWGDAGCYGHPRIQTPNLDKFASEGLRLTQCYAGCSVCSPSRSAILTGRTPYRNGVWRWIPGGSKYHLRASEITIAEVLKEIGYDTCHAGKWHLNGKFNSDEQPQPDDHGYDHWLATQNNASPNHMNPVNFVRNGQEVGQMIGPSSVLCAEEAANWLESRKDSGNPFFLTVWTHEPHLPIESAEEYMEPYADIDDEGIRQHHGNITQLDAAFGNLMAAVDRLGYRDTTLVAFTSDNGPEGKGTGGRTRGSTGGLRGRKRASHEGGIRVPGIIRWPGHIARGTESDTPVIGSDLFPTICEIVGARLPSDRTIDGTSILPVFDGNSIERDQPLYWRNHLAPDRTKVAMRIGDWKILASNDLTQFELYNVQKDWQETTDLAESNPEKLAVLREKLAAHDAAVLEEGPDWWKDDNPRERQSRKTTEPKAGVDQTGEFDRVLGATVTKSGLGYRLISEAEGLALQKLEKPLTGRVRLSGKYASKQKDGVTRNAAIVIGASPTLHDTIKIGTAIGMNQHVAFSSNWGNVGSHAKRRASFEPLDIFEIAIDIDLVAHQAKATINGQVMKFDLPVSLKQIEWVGYYVKSTESEFSALTIE